MATMTWVGMDVHARSTQAAAVDVMSGELTRMRFGPGVGPVVEWLRDLPQPLRGCYEAGPTGYGLYRAGREAGLEVEVIAPSKTPRAAGEQVKSDRKDAELLVRLLMAGALTPVRVPPPETEAARDLSRARDQLRGDLMRCRHRVSKLLLRHGRVYEGGGTWTQAHRRWLAGQRFACGATELAYLDALAAVDGLLSRREELDRRLSELALGEAFWPTVARLRCFRGVDTLSALALHLEVHDWRRFERAPQLAAWLGLTPSLHQSGESSASGSITKTGSTYARRLLVEAAKHYGRPPRCGVVLARRQEGQPDHVLATAWRAQHRLFRLRARLRERGKPANLADVAVARELACFLWAAAVAD
jgi:transposase